MLVCRYIICAIVGQTERYLELIKPYAIGVITENESNPSTAIEHRDCIGRNITIIIIGSQMMNFETKMAPMVMLSCLVTILVICQVYVDMRGVMCLNISFSLHSRIMYITEINIRMKNPCPNVTRPSIGVSLPPIWQHPEPFTEYALSWNKAAITMYNPVTIMWW